MNLLKSVENTIARLVEGSFGRAFRSEVRPMELARKLAREMDAHRTVSVSRVYVPNEYLVWLSPEDRARYEGVEEEVIEELCGYLLEHARGEDLILASALRITFHTDERLALGEFGIQARLVRPDGQSAGEGASTPHAPPAAGGAGAPPQDVHGKTMIYSTSARVRGPVEATQARRRSRALLAVSGRRILLPPAGGTVGRSRDCDVVLEDAGISRRHATIRPAGAGWEIEDLGSTNGVLVNGLEISGPQALEAGDRIEFGSTEALFEIG
ncbi:MAG: FhaA domain-containing protein [Solirubrobacteraceae bacterium]